MAIFHQTDFIKSNGHQKLPEVAVGGDLPTLKSALFVKAPKKRLILWSRTSKAKQSCVKVLKREIGMQMEKVLKS